jgi:hypothetical protein
MNVAIAIIFAVLVQNAEILNLSGTFVTLAVQISYAKYFLGNFQFDANSTA